MIDDTPPAGGGGRPRLGGRPVAATEEILGQFLGDDAFPVHWDSDVEKDFFWVYDDLHIPHPVSPMFFDIGGWWLSCDHMFRRFGTPFAVDWLAKNVNGYVYTTAVPADPDLRIEGTEYSSSYTARVPRDPSFAAGMGKYLDTVLPVYGQQFADWWRERLVPEMQRNFAYLEDRLDQADRMSLPELATLLEDAIDIHDRHWKIHWMLNFAQLSATLNLRAVMERVRGEVDDELLGRLQNSASDRNWDSIEALWKMKNEVRDDPELRAAFDRGGADAAAIGAALRDSERGRRFIAERIEPYQREFGWHAVWSHEFIFPTVREEMEPVLDLIRDYLASDYDYPTAIASMRADIEAASREILDGLDGEALEEMRAANAINLRMAPLTPDHHFYIDQGANAHVRLVLIAIGRKLVADGRLDRPDDVLFLRYNELRMLIGDQAFDGRPIVAERRAAREAARKVRPRNWVGTVTPSQLAFPYLVNWGYPDRFYQEQATDEGPITGIAGSPGVIEGTARVVMTIDEFDEVTDGDILVCQMTNPAWVVLFTKIAGLVTDTGGTTSHPAVLSREFGIPAVVGTSSATHRIATGDRIRVDGSKGVVEVLEHAGSAGPAGAAAQADSTAAPTDPAAAIGS
jgi:phosphohistidine swiveling domain-containing protein